MAKAKKRVVSDSEEEYEEAMSDNDQDKDSGEDTEPEETGTTSAGKRKRNPSSKQKTLNNDSNTAKIATLQRQIEKLRKTAKKDAKSAARAAEDADEIESQDDDDLGLAAFQGSVKTTAVITMDDSGRPQGLNIREVSSRSKPSKSTSSGSASGLQVKGSIGNHRSSSTRHPDVRNKGTTGQQSSRSSANGSPDIAADDGRSHASSPPVSVDEVETRVEQLGKNNVEGNDERRKKKKRKTTDSDKDAQGGDTSKATPSPCPPPLKPGVNPLSTKLNARDYPDDVKTIVLAAIKRYKAPLLSHGGYIGDTDRYKWAGLSWIDECKVRGANYTSDVRVCKVIKARGPNIRGIAMNALRPIVAQVFNFQMLPKYTKKNIKIYERLKKGGWSFQYKDIDNQSGYAESPHIIKMVVAVLFGSANDAGMLYPKMFRPIPLEFLSFLFTMVQFCLEEWATGQHKTDVELREDIQKQWYAEHLSQLQGWEASSKKVNAESEFCVNYRKKIFDKALKQSALKPKDGPSGGGFSEEAQKRIEEELSMRTGETDSSDEGGDRESESDVEIEPVGAPANSANNVDVAAST